MPMLIKLSHTREEEEEEGILPGLSYKVNTTLILKPNKKQQQKRKF